MNNLPHAWLAPDPRAVTAPGRLTAFQSILPLQDGPGLLTPQQTQIAQSGGSLVRLALGSRAASDFSYGALRSPESVGNRTDPATRLTASCKGAAETPLTAWPGCSRSFVRWPVDHRKGLYIPPVCEAWTRWRPRVRRKLLRHSARQGNVRRQWRPRTPSRPP